MSMIGGCCSHGGERIAYRKLGVVDQYAMLRELGPAEVNLEDRGGALKLF